VSLNTKIKELLHPKEYPILLADKALPGTTLLKVQSPARYVIHIQEFDTKLNVSAQIALARKTIYKRSGALWLFKEVGACIVFTCKHLPNVVIEDLLVDKSGFHAVIIQGVHLVDEKGEQICNQSKWINRTFGKSTDVAKALRSVAI